MVVQRQPAGVLWKEPHHRYTRQAGNTRSALPDQPRRPPQARGFLPTGGCRARDDAAAEHLNDMPCASAERRRSGLAGPCQMGEGGGTAQMALVHMGWRSARIGGRVDIG